MPNQESKRALPEAVAVTEDGTNEIVRPGDATNHAVRVNVVASTGGGLTDAELRASPVPVSGSFSATTTAKATAAAPSYVEGTDSPLSQDLAGNIRTLATAETAAKATAADPAYVEGTTNPISQDLSGHVRVVAGALPLPSGAATAAKQDTGNTSLASIDGKDFATQTTLALIKAKTDNLDVALSTRTKPADTQKVDGSAVTQPVSAVALPLPSGASTAARQDTGNTSVASIDGKLPAALDGSGFLKVHEQGTAAISAASLPLPTGASTAARQDTGNTSLASIDGKLTNPLPVSGAVTAAKSTAAAPTYLEAASNPLSMDLAGNLRVVSVGSTTYFPLTESSTYDGVSATLTLGHTPTDEPRVFVGGLRWYLGVHYSRVGAVITWISIPISGETLQVDYTWSMASSTLNTTLVVDASGNVQPTGDTSARPIHVVDDVLAISQGAVMAGAKGPMVQGIVSDTVQQFFNDVIQPLQLTADGRLRVQTSSESNNFTAWGDPLDTGEGATMGALLSWG